MAVHLVSLIQTNQYASPVVVSLFAHAHGFDADKCPCLAKVCHNFVCQKRGNLCAEAIWVATMSFSLLGLLRRGLTKIQYCTRL